MYVEEPPELVGKSQVLDNLSNMYFELWHLYRQLHLYSGRSGHYGRVWYQ